MPKAIINMKLYTSDCEFGTTLNGTIFLSFWMTLASECLREFNASCVSANVDFSMIQTMDNIEFECSGYNTSMPNLMTEAIDCLLDIKNTEDLEEMFNQQKEKLLLIYKN